MASIDVNQLDIAQPTHDRDKVISEPLENTSPVKTERAVDAKAIKDTAIPTLEAAKLLLDEWKFRQQHCWGLLPRYGFAAAVISVAPYLRLDLLTQPIIKLWVFPTLGWFLALAATWLFLAEQYRSYSVLAHYRKLLGEGDIHRTDTRLDKILDKTKVRWITPAIFLVSFTLLSILNICILYKLL